MTAHDDAVCPTCGTVYPIARTHCANDGTRLVQRRAQAASAAGRVLDNRFEVREPLGEGVIGTVYRGLQRSVDREVAIKILRPAFASDRETAERVFQAAQLAAQLAAPSIATTYDFGRTEDGLIFLVMELVRGRTLTEESQGRAMSIRRVVPIAIQICDALDAAEKQQVFHGDLKPTNIMVLDDVGGREIVKVSDFGLGRAVTPDVSAVEVGRVLYLAPEVASTGVVTARSDLYSLGCVLYQLLAGKLPHEDSSTRGLLDKHARQAPARLPREIPPNVTSIISRLLAKAPDQRFDSAAAVRAALYAVLGRTVASGVPSTSSDDMGSRKATGASSRPHRSPTGSHTQPGVHHTGTFQPTGVSHIHQTGVSAIHQIGHPRTGVSQMHPNTGVSQMHPNTGVSAMHPNTGVSAMHPHTGVSAMHPNTGPSGIQPPYATPPPAPVEPVPTPSSSRRMVVIAIVALVVTGLGLVAYTLVG